MDDDIKNEVDKMRWSFSRVSSFEHCKYAFYLNYIINDDNIYLAEGNFYAEVGSFIHEILAMIFNGELSLDDAPSYYAEHYDEAVCYKVKQSISDKAYEACADYFANVDFDWLKDYDILGVELETKLKIDKYDFIGYIDLLLRNKKTNEIWLIDHKSSAYPFKKNGEVLAKQKDSFEQYKKQMYLYCHAVKEMFGDFPTKITWNHFKDNKMATIDFNKEDYDKSLKWFIDTIHVIEKEKKFEATQDFFYCTNLCDFRNSCEYRNFNNES